MVNFKHWLTLNRNPFPLFFFSRKEQKKIVSCIRKAEMRTSGEIRVHLLQKASLDLLTDGQHLFETLGMVKTADRNGILIVICPASRNFIILGDKGIHERVGAEFWKDHAEILQSHFSQDRFSDGLLQVIESMGEQLAKHFPYERRDVNELPDVISYS